MDITGTGGLRPFYEQEDPRSSQISDRVNSLKSTSDLPAAEDAKLKAACQEFESYFLYMMLKEMRKTVPETKMIHGGRAEEIFRDMLDEETSKNLAKSPNSSIGIGQILYDQLSRPNIIRNR